MIQLLFLLIFNLQAQTLWHIEPNIQSTKAILIVHGLNTLPSKMDSLGRFFAEKGYHSYRLSLPGHSELLNKNERLNEMKLLTATMLSNFVEDAFNQISKEHEQVTLLGYSLGGLLGANLISAGKITPHKVIYLAPAIELTNMSQMIQLISWIPNLSIPSFSEKECRANDETSSEAYVALFDLHEDFHKNLNKNNLNIASLVVVDKNDELVSYTKIKELVVQELLSNWKVRPISKDDSAVYDYHHLVYDRKSLGKNSWEELKEMLTKFITD